LIYEGVRSTNHPAADDVECAGLRQTAGIEFPREVTHLQILQCLPGKIHLLRLPRHSVVVVAEIDAQFRGEIGQSDIRPNCRRPRARSTGSPASGRARRSNGASEASALDGSLMTVPGARPSCAGPAGGRSGRPARRFHHECIRTDRSGTWQRTGALRPEQHVAGEKQLPGVCSWISTPAAPANMTRL